MKSIQINKYGGSNVIDVNNEILLAKIFADKALVKVKTSGVNPVDWKIQEGYFQQLMPLQFPATLGMDFSGIIKESDRDSSTPFKVDDEVYAQASILFGESGSFAELAVVNLSSIAAKPKTLNHIETS
ncbi:alcohol dehydrogenase catalytic domain-containing protein [Candidatus Nitrosocosmicus agrestis]|uniref:alcohol dehydrogenase catalytic domain-containing protein n=1 Tax=Candidatus Nitrosocosmicus agrestis TaxID=2563600 RepID=UPI00133150B8|nr:alcohol dehydrogenase catalytic domain-containing protein [Candidatus Nitrosocosmicus sp. SS]MDR4492817.1 alcohol dehydrogenase catalytic domain-containing protein [Candidatus Nitrosocosmicus sp.]